jgi:predicted DNA-binding transcriptional regulator YafY
VDHAAPPLVVDVDASYPTVNRGQFLSAIRTRIQAMSTSARMLRLLSLLQTHRFWSGGELAERLEVTERTLRRDVDRLRDLGYPVNATPGVGGGYQLEAGTVLPPLLLDDDEAIAIAVGLRTSAGGAVAGAQETSVRALAKVIRMMPPRLRRQADALAAATAPPAFSDGPTVDAGALAILAGAAQDAEVVRFEYRPRTGSPATRTVEPHRLVPLGRRWYLVAWDLDREDWRTFRIDRLDDPRSIRRRFVARKIPGDDAAAFVQAQLGSAPARFEIEAVIELPVADVERLVGRWGSVERMAETSSRIRMNVDQLDWPAMVLAASGAPFRVVGPPELVDYVADAGRRFTAATADR